MPTKPPTPSGVIKINLVHGLGTDLHIGTALFWSYTGSAPSAANLNTLAGSVGSAWASDLASLLSNAGLLESVQCTDLASASGATGQSLTTHAGTRAGNPPTMAACAQINFSVARRYRGGKPKAFFPFGITTDMGTQFSWNSTFITAVNSGYASFQTAVNGLTAGPATLVAQQNVSYFSGSTSNPNSSKWGRRNIPAMRGTPLVEPITAAGCRVKLGSQRRRIAAS